MKHYSESAFLKAVNAIIEYLLIIVAYYLSGVVRGLIAGSIISQFAMSDITMFLPFALTCALLMVMIYSIIGDYGTIRMYSVAIESKRILFVQAIGGLVGAAILFLVQGTQFSRVLLFIFIFFSAFFILIKRILFERIATKVFGAYLNAYNILMVGGSDLTKRFLKDSDKAESGRYNVLGYLAEEENPTISGYLGKIGELQNIALNNKIDEVYITEDTNKDEIKHVLTICGMYGIKSFLIPSFTDYMIERKMTCTAGGLNIVPVGIMNTSNILGVNIAVTNMEKTIDDIKYNLDNWRGKYICVSNVHTTVMAHENKDYLRVQNGAVLALPDGSPLSSYSRKTGQENAKRVTGPDLMKEMLLRSKNAVKVDENSSRNFRHFFYGSTQETLDKLKVVLSEKYKDAEIVGMISPPFRELTPEEDMDYIELINKAKPDFVWVGLGAPKQEIWMAAHENKINAIMIGVGAAFDYESGNIKRAPKWMQKMSLEWLYRLMQDPKRLFKRYLVTNVKYIWLSNKRQ